MPDSPIETDGPGLIIIGIISDTDPVTGNCTVNFTATLPNASEPDLTLSFYELSGTDKLPLTVSPAPSTTWTNGVGSFSIDMDSAIFDQLTSTQTTFGVYAAGTNPNSKGDCTIGIDLI